MSAQLNTALAQAWQLEPMQTVDLIEVMRIEERAYTHPWTRGNFEDSLNAGYNLQCVWREHKGIVKRRELLGYFVTMPVVDEVHLLNLTASPLHQRQGLGRWLLGQAHAQAELAAAQAMWLEVRPSNTAALALYAQYGFALVARRRDYYPAVGGKREDALVLKLVIGNAGAHT
jgi:[ribosomal protein S18]-alanine N-acetyltransferase